MSRDFRAVIVGALLPVAAATVARGPQNPIQGKVRRLAEHDRRGFVQRVYDER
jgi:hypothetical protein